MTYTRINWQDGENGGTPLSAANLNKMDEQIEKNTNNILSIIESGSNENGSWIKFSDGTMITYQSIYYSNLSCITWGSLYTTGALTITNFPISFVEPPTVNYSWSVDSANCWVSTHDGQKKTKDHAGGIQLVRPTFGTISGTLEMIAIGKWK